MKNLMLCICVVTFLSNCKDKYNNSIPNPDITTVAPKADFTYSTGEFGEINIRFTINHKDFYAIDLGNGTILKDSVNNPQMDRNYQATKTVRFTKNGNYTITLTLANSKGVSSSTQVININNIPPLPLAAFRYETTADGIKLSNQSKDYQTMEWRHGRKGSLMGYTSWAENPELKFENNGLYYINLRVSNKYGVVDEKRDSVEITHLENTNNPTFEGIFFNKSGILKGESVNTFQETWGPGALYGYSVQYFIVKDAGSIFLVNGKPETLSVESKRSFLKDRLKPGDVKEGDWSIMIGKGGPIFENPDNTFDVKRTPGAVFEITEVSEADQPKLFPEVYQKAYWVTYRVKIDLGTKGKVDGKLKVRYLIY